MIYNLFLLIECLYFDMFEFFLFLIFDVYDFVSELLLGMCLSGV